MKTSKPFPTLLEAFFTDRLMRQRRASPHTVASYRDTFRLLLRYLEGRFKKCPASITLEDLHAQVILDFLNHIEETRGNKPRSRNARLAAIRSFFQYVSFEEPGHADMIQRVLAIPNKRWHRRLVSFLTPEETEALLRAPDVRKTGGRRDHVLLLLATQTGLRVSELIGLRCSDVVFSAGPYIRCQGKGRKERCIPLTKSTAKVMKTWLHRRNGSTDGLLFTNARGGKLSRDGVAYILKKSVSCAAQRCTSLRTKRVSPHTLRHTTAVNLLRAGADPSMIALWLGHESVETTQMYLHADMAYKKKILSKVATGKVKLASYSPGDRLLAFLNSL